MGRFRHGHARLDQAAGNWQPCDYCSMIYSRSDLSWAYEWAGTKLQNLNYLVCPKCLDVPSAGLRTVIPGPDPTPIPNVRAIPFANWRNNEISTEQLDPIATEDDNNLITED